VAQRNNGRPRTSGANPSSKGQKFVNAGSFAGGFAGGVAGGMASTFTPNINVNINRGGGNGGQSRSSSLLPPPDFSSPALVRNYCNSLRAAGVMLSMEVAIAAEILQGVLAAVPDPEGRAFGSRIRAAKVSRKLRKSADARPPPRRTPPPPTPPSSRRTRKRSTV
jgi:hypothetical protein